MGDNFAPNYFSRVFSGGSIDNGKDLYTWNGSKWAKYDANDANTPEALHGHETIPTDNVACFLAQAGYTAIVPGKHDFYYGPQRLRALARFLASIPDTEKDFQPVQMAANLMIKTSWVKDHTPIPDSGKPRLPFVTKFVSSLKNSDHDLEIEDFSDGGYALPWMQFVRVTATGWKKNELDKQLELVVCKAHGNPDQFLTRDGTCIDGESLGHEYKVAPENDTTYRLVYKLPMEHLLHEEYPNFAICANDPDLTAAARASNKNGPYCVRFTVYHPFLQYPDWPAKGGMGAGNTPYTNPAPYALSKDGQTVIFGVVDPKLAEHIGGDNFAWENVRLGSHDKVSDPPIDTAYTSQIAVADPVQSIIQLNDYFEHEYFANHSANFRGRRVLLAQMPADEAKQLAEHLPRCLRFDVVIAASDDTLATPDGDMFVHPAQLKPASSDACEGDGSPTDFKKDGSLQTPPAVVFVPPTHQRSPFDHDRAVQAHALTLLTDSRTSWDYYLSGPPIHVGVPSTDQLQPLIKDFWTTICYAVFNDRRSDCSQRWDNSNKDAKQALMQELALWAMYNYQGADVSLLQKRDFYLDAVEDYLREHCTVQGTPPQCVAGSVPNFDTQEVLSRILWKGDFIDTRPVQGSVLKSIMKQSKNFSKIEKAAYLPVEEAGRDLVTLGIVEDTVEGGDYLINQKPLDPNALYAVATSDYIALGDTGYSDLATPPVGNPSIPARPQNAVISISAEACEQVRAFDSRVMCQSRIANPKDYYDQIANQHPNDARSGNTNLHKLYAWSLLQVHLGQMQSKRDPKPADANLDRAEHRLASRPNWDISVDQLSLGFTALTHNGSEDTLSKRFAGVQNGNVNAAHSHEFDLDANSSFRRFHPRYDWFATETLQYYSKFQAQASKPAAETQLKNTFMVDGGSYLHLHPLDSKNLPQFSAVLAGHFETQVANPLITNLSITVPSPATFPTIKQGRTRTLLGRAGLRYENRKSYIEVGLEGGEVLNAIKAFRFSNGSIVLKDCTLQASQTLSNCVDDYNKNNSTMPITTTSMVTILRAPQPRYGAYSKISLTVPLHPIISYNFQDTSDFFFNSRGDNSADTRFRHTIVNALKFKIFPSLSFEPTYTIFFYENKVDYNTLFQQQYSVKINLSFDWSNWHEFWEQVQFKKPGS